jgi:hypothetical protein
VALTSRFATAKYTGGGIVPKKPVGVKLPAPTGLLSQALGPQSVAAPTAPAVAAAAPHASVLPPDASYEQQVALLGQQHDIDLSNLTQAKQQALSQYGYTQDSAGALAFDATNPFSQAAMLKRNYDQAQRGNTNSYAARGQLYSGALQNAQNQTAFQNQAGNDALQKSLLGFLANNTQGVAQSGVNYQTGLAGAEGTRVQNAATNPLYEAAAAPAAPAVSPAAQAAVGDPVVSSIPWKDSANHPGKLNIHKSGARVFVRS